MTHKNAEKNIVQCTKLWAINSSFCSSPKARCKLAPWVLLRAVYTMLPGVYQECFNTRNRAFILCQFSKRKLTQPQETFK